MRGTGFPKHAESTELRGLCKALEFCALKPKSVIRLWVDCPLMSCGLLFGLQKA